MIAVPKNTEVPFCVGRKTRSTASSPPNMSRILSMGSAGSMFFTYSDLIVLKSLGGMARGNANFVASGLSVSSSAGGLLGKGVVLSVCMHRSAVSWSEKRAQP